MDGQLARDWDGCFFYRTGECSPEGPRQPGLDLPCKAQVREGWSGYCQCADGRQTYHVGCENHAPFRCEDACRVPEDWCADNPRFEALQMAVARDSLGSLWLRRLCDPYFYDDGQCDVSCGASDPVRNPPQWPVPQTVRACV